MTKKPNDSCLGLLPDMNGLQITSSNGRNRDGPGPPWRVFPADTQTAIDAAFANLKQERSGALLLGNDPVFTNWGEHIVALAIGAAIPTVYFAREFVVRGGLMSYGTRIADAYHQAGIYAGQILKGIKPADLPVLQPTKFELAINLKTAKALGLPIPDKL